MFKNQQSFTGSCPVFPPNTTKYGLEYVMEWPYLRPGVYPTTGTTVHIPVSSEPRISKKYKSSDAKLSPEIKKNNNNKVA